MKSVAKAYMLGNQPMVLKELYLACDINQVELTTAVVAQLGRTVSRTTLNLTINRGYIPLTIHGYREAIEAVIRANPRAMSWLLERDKNVANIWDRLDHQLANRYPAGHGKRVHARPAAAADDDTNLIEGGAEMHEMLHPDAMKKYHLFRNPFMNDVTCEKDIYMSDEHRYIEAAMMSAALNCGFLAVIGEVQSGKSTIRKKVEEQLHRAGDISVIIPRNNKINIRGKNQCRIDATSLCDAIIMDISGETPCNKTEAKVRQLERLLITRTNGGNKHVLIIEEAHNLTPVAFKYLKQFYEMEDGFKKLLSIIILGQTELMEYLDERKHPELREVSRRIQVAEIQGLNSNLADYLKFKFKRINVQAENIFTEDAFEALSRRLTIDNGKGRKISHAYPGLVNLYAIKAINSSFEFGADRVTAEIVESI